ncbi:spore germination protein [Cohnella sp. CFH 77786]|uniref:spore germination protein n=1 Tax=Cohnella sp. CFH 77786 TaxID=2662265 RepID=UPI001C611154
MSCYIGRIIIVRNEGTVIIGNVRNISPSETSRTTEGAGQDLTGEGTNATAPITLPTLPTMPPRAR